MNARAGSYLATERPRRIAVFRALQLGDLLCAVPAMRALRATLPDAHIAMIGLPTMEGFTRRYAAYVDEFIVFPGAPGFPEQDERTMEGPRFAERMRGRQLDLAIQMHGNGGPANRIVESFGARTTAGFHRPHVHDESGVGLFVDWDVAASEVGRNLALMRGLGADAAALVDASLELPITREERGEWLAIRRLHALDAGPFVCVHPGARWSSRRWPVERFAAVAADLSARGARVVLTGSGDERELVGRLADLLLDRGVVAVDLSGRTSLGALVAMLRDAQLLVSNDTGISHVAAAAGTASVVVASGSDVARWSPVDRQRHRVLSHDVPCRPCMYRDCPIDHPCATGVSVDAVIHAATRHPVARRFTNLALTDHAA